MMDSARWMYAILATVVMTGIAGAMFYGKGPPPAVTNAPGEDACQAGKCHVQYPLNSGPGTLSLAGVPSRYKPGEQYRLTISLAQMDQKRWGFQLTALDSSQQPAGELSPAVENLTQKKTGEMPDSSKRQYITHTAAGTYPGKISGPVHWEILWQAPVEDAGPIFFYTSANAANFNKNPRGDYIYTRIDTTKSALRD